MKNAINVWFCCNICGVPALKQKAFYPQINADSRRFKDKDRTSFQAARAYGAIASGPIIGHALLSGFCFRLQSL
ncbi:MAG: hypothetical protein PF501_17020 [Salinisphaera sp.]|jgi:hypothetical protein|nr:hypothetical protein [Salinisphaera sp.]